MPIDDERGGDASGPPGASRWLRRADYGVGKLVNLRIAAVFAAGCVLFALFAVISIVLAEQAVAAFTGAVSLGCFVLAVRYARRRQRLSGMREF